MEANPEHRNMDGRSYAQYCPVAIGLDVGEQARPHLVAAGCQHARFTECGWQFIDSVCWL